MANNEISEQEQQEALHKPIVEEFVSALPITGEEILNKSRNHNAWIVIGRDRPSDEKSGYGQLPKNKGGDKCSTIDIVVGRYSKDSGKGDFKKNFGAGNNIHKDAARIYISQKTDIDENFQIQKAGTLVPAIGKSAIGLKADNLRFVSRQSVKIVANSGDANSLDGSRDLSIKPIYGIQLITGYETEAEDVQSIVKSENLREYLEELMDKIDTLAASFSDYLIYQADFNEAVASHTHKGVFNSIFAGSVDVFESLKLPAALTKNSKSVFGTTAINLQNVRTSLNLTLKNKYLSKATNAKKYIGSPYNKTN